MSHKLKLSKPDKSEIECNYVYFIPENYYFVHLIYSVEMYLVAFT